MENIAMVEAAVVTIYMLSYKDGDRKRSAVLQPGPNGEGYIMDENPADSGIMEGRLMSGGLFRVPLSDIITILPVIWKRKFFTGQTTRTDYHTTGNIEQNLEHMVDDPQFWDEHGHLKDTTGIDETEISPDRKVHKKRKE